jgi:hypothetical protein
VSSSFKGATPWWLGLGHGVWNDEQLPRRDESGQANDPGESEAVHAAPYAAALIAVRHNVVPRAHCSGLSGERKHDRIGVPRVDLRSTREKQGDGQ